MGLGVEDDVWNESLKVPSAKPKMLEVLQITHSLQQVIRKTITKDYGGAVIDWKRLVMFRPSWFLSEKNHLCWDRGQVVREVWLVTVH
jgi:hypothetical protein